MAHSPQLAVSDPAAPPQSLSAGRISTPPPSPHAQGERAGAGGDKRLGE